MPARRILRRITDVLVSGIALVLLAPLLIAVAILVTADSPGPVLRRQERISRAGRTFQLVTFRTTKQGSGATRIGNTLRRYAIDAFPGLWNVVVGDMSFIDLWRTVQTISRTVGAH